MTGILILIVLGAVGFGYAVYSHYNAAPASTPVLKRVWFSIVGAAAAIGAAVGSWVIQHTPTPPTP
jgi:hypothetical protein